MIFTQLIILIQVSGLRVEAKGQMEDWVQMGEWMDKMPVENVSVRLDKISLIFILPMVIIPGMIVCRLFLLRLKILVPDPLYHDICPLNT
jgi:hypothetical protein